MVTLTRHACKYKVHKLSTYRRRLQSLCTFYLHACQVRVTVETQVFVAVLVLRISSAS